MEFTPNEIVKELDRNIIGQKEAKRAVAIALRNRYRRSLLSDELREEITPKNIIMQGPTGVGKTEIARRLAKLVKAPFVKVEATKFTEVGYVGRDVESMIRDLVEVSIRMVKAEMAKGVEKKAIASVEKELLPAVLKELKSDYPDLSESEYKETIMNLFYAHKLDDREITIEMQVNDRPQELVPGSGISLDIGALMGGGKKRKNRKIKIGDAYREMLQFEEEKLLDEDSVNSEAIRRAENQGIIFIDEIDKIANKGASGRGGQDVSREGVQRDILPIVEGCTVNTKYGQIKTDYILFIASGAFQLAQVRDLIPELQGRFPINVKLDSLTADDFVEILSSTDNALLMQYTELLKVDNVYLSFTNEAIKEIANIAVAENENNEDIGARRLHNIMETLLSDISFNAGGLTTRIDLTIDKKYVLEHLDKTIQTLNLKKFIL